MCRFAHVVLFCAFLSVAAAGQTKGPATPSRKRSSACAERAVPTIKCDDHATAAACKSFKELVQARDKQILKEVLGDPCHDRSHVSYVCLRPQSDAFSVIEFDVPEPRDYHAPSSITEDLARSADDSLPTNRQFRDTLESAKQAIENLEFSDFSDPPAVSSFTKDHWFQDHGKEFVYSSGGIVDFRYQDGIDAGSVYDFGEWSMLATNKSSKQQDLAAWFVGGYAWIERFNLQHADVSARDDNPEHGHITLDPDTIQVHYKFENVSGATVDYTLHVHRLTGRFVETFESPSGNDEASGTCMMFK